MAVANTASPNAKPRAPTDSPWKTVPSSSTRKPLMGRPPADERGEGSEGRRKRPGSRAGRRRIGRRRFQPERNREVPPTKTASERKGSVGKTWFPPRERGPLQRPRAKPEDAQGKAGGERRSRRVRHPSGGDRQPHPPFQRLPEQPGVLRPRAEASLADPPRGLRVEQDEVGRRALGDPGRLQPVRAR